MKETKYHTTGTVSNANRKFVEKGNIDTPNIQFFLTCYRHLQVFFYLKMFMPCTILTNIKIVLP